MRANETVIPNDSVMAKMIATPKDAIIANAREWLDSIILKDKNILANRC
jgi:hypothetical protein